MAEQIKIDIAASYDDKNAKKALADAEKIDGLKPEMEISADVDRALNAFDEVVAETKRVQAAADALAQALGPELTAKADPTAIVQDLRQMGLTLDDITANADKLGNKLKEVSDADVGGKLGSSLGTTRGKLDEVNKSAESSRSALANMVGNSAQDLGQLGGIAGSSGVAIGQMAEYASDAALAGESMGSALASMAAVAGPIAAMSLAIQGVSSILNAMKQGQAVTKAFDTEQVKQFTEAVQSGEDVTKSYNATLAKTGEVLADTGIKAGPAWAKILPGVSDLTRSLGLWGKFGDTIENILPTLNHAGISADIWTKTITAGADKQVAAMDTLRAALDATNISDDDRSKILIAARAAQDNYTDSVNNSAATNKFFSESQDGVTDSVKAGSEQLSAYLDFLYKQGAANRDAKDAAEEQIRQTALLNQQYEVQKNKIAAVNVERDKVDAQAELRREKGAVEDVSAAYQHLHDVIADRRSLLELQGQFDTLKEKADAAWFATASGADDATQKQRDYDIALGDTIQQSLDYIATIEGIPDKAVTDIQAMIDQGHYNQALTALEALSAPRSVALKATLDEQQLDRQLAAWYASHGVNPLTAKRAAGGVGGGRTLVGEEGPEIVDLPPGSRVIPAPITSAMMHNGNSAPMIVNVNMPRGSRGVDVLRQVTSQARRSGRRYGVPVVHYARR